MKEKPCLYIVIPCYNEQEVLPITAPQFLGELTHLIESGKVSDDSRILFVNDGSKDRTWELICEYAEQDPHYTGISQSRNRGHQSTVLAGLMDAKDRCDITISIDCDDCTGILQTAVIDGRGNGIQPCGLPPCFFPCPETLCGL